MRKNRCVLLGVLAMFLLTVFLTSCTKQSDAKATTQSEERSNEDSKESKEKESMTATETQMESASDTKSEEEVLRIEKNKAAYKDFDFEDQWITIWSKPGVEIHDLGDVYEVKNVCLAKGVSYEYTPEMFENAMIGDTISLPNGEFILSEVSDHDTGERKSKEIVVDNGYFWQQFSITDEGVLAIGIGEYILLESLYIGDVYVAKDAKFTTYLEGNPDEIVTRGFKEAVFEDANMQNYGFFFSAVEVDKDGVIRSLDEPYIP